MSRLVHIPPHEAAEEEKKEEKEEEEGEEEEEEEEEESLRAQCAYMYMRARVTEWGLPACRSELCSAVGGGASSLPSSLPPFPPINPKPNQLQLTTTNYN
eukprot:GHVU01049424.1.p3 GENE.GHVU01049424.1~~GHVU01049424.1.p3  ORF type:complete len:100 (+),score=36.72 GHVU01049424.1:3-302(+)